MASSSVDWPETQIAIMFKRFNEESYDVEQNGGVQG